MKFVKSTLGKIALEIKTGKTPPTSNQEYFGDELNWYTPTDLDREKILGKSKRRITQKAFNDKKVAELKPNTVLIGCIGDIGKIGLIKETATSNQQITGILPNEEVLNSNFLYYWLKHNRRKLQDASNSAIVPILNNKQLSTIEIEFPERINDQIRIAEILTKAETLINQRKESISMLDELLRSSFLEMFGDPVRNEKGWDKETSEKYLSKLTVGVVIKPASYYVDKGIIALRSLNIRPNQIDLKNIVYFSKETNDNELSKSVLREGDVVFVRTGLTGTAAVIPKELDGCNCVDLIITRPKTDVVNPKYLAYFFNSDIGKKIVLSKQVGGIQKHFNIGALKELKIPIPPIKLQNQFATLVEKVETIKKEFQKSLVELENLYRVLSQKAFKGELIKDEKNNLKKKDYTVMEEEPDEIIDIKNYIKEKKEKVDITNMTFVNYVGFPEEFQIRDEKWMALFLGQKEFYQFLLKDNFKDASFNLSDIEMKFHNFFYQYLDMDFDNEAWRSAIFEFMKSDPPLIIQRFDEESATIKLELTDEAYKA